MPNWCYTSYTFVGDEEELKGLHDLMKGLEERSEPLVKMTLERLGSVALLKHSVRNGRTSDAAATGITSFLQVIY